MLESFFIFFFIFYYFLILNEVISWTAKITSDLALVNKTRNTGMNVITLEGICRIRTP